MYAALRQIAKRSPLGTVVRWWKRRYRPVTAAEPAAQPFSDYDRDTFEIVRRTLTGKAVGIDVGAHAGDILKVICAAAPQGRHHAFEPLPHLAAALRANFPGVNVHQKAAGASPGTATFLHVVNDPGYSGLRKRDYDRPDPLFEELTVEVVRIDDVVGPAENVRLIKLDLEGGEYHALRGALGTIRRCRPVIVFEAALRSTGFYGISADQLFDLVCTEMGGYALYTLRNWLSGGPGYTRDGFRQNWHDGPEYYFVAAPARGA